MGMTQAFPPAPPTRGLVDSGDSEDHRALQAGSTLGKLLTRPLGPRDDVLMSGDRMEGPEKLQENYPHTKNNAR